MQEFYNDFLDYKLINTTTRNVISIDSLDCNSITITNTSPNGFVNVNGVQLSPNEIIKFVGKEKQILINQKINIRWDVFPNNKSVTIIRKKYINNVTKL